MDTTLCFDFGNTRLKCGVFLNDSLEEVISLPDTTKATIEDLLKKYRPVKTMLSSVLDPNPDMEELLNASSQFHKLSSHSILPFTTPVNHPETIGADRLALAAGAVHLYKGKNNLVIGLGSCVTYNFINKYSSFIGGSISPGMEMRLKSLHIFTAKLPLINASLGLSRRNFPLIGYDTLTNILSGVIIGLAAEIDGIIGRYREQFSNINVLLTGGDALYLSHFLENTIIADPDLLFKGLWAISESNLKGI